MKFKSLLYLLSTTLVCISSNALGIQVANAGQWESGPVKVAVASNFTHTMTSLIKAFEGNSQNKVIISHGSSGKLYAQIKNGAPYQLFFSADQHKPLALEQAGVTVKGSRFTYAIGRLALWTPQPENKLSADTLRQNKFSKLALANPKLAPYGVAAFAVLNKLNLLEPTQAKRILGENVAQTYQFVSTRNADFGFVALAQVMRNGQVTTGSAWVIPEDLYQPIRQDAVLLNRGKDSAAAQALIKFMRSDQAQSILEAYGYRMPLN